MGVDWYGCHYCGETFPDCGFYLMCDCGNRWDSKECAEAEGYREEKDGDSCSFCRDGEMLEDSDLVLYLLDRLELSREVAVSDYFNSYFYKRHYKRHI